MFCPKCGQSQSSDALRFCSRCGFPLLGVAQLLARDGAPFYAVAAPAGPQPASPRRKGVRQGGAVMLLGVFLIPVLALLHPLFGMPGELAVLGVIVFLAGLLRVTFAALFQDAAPRAAQGPPLYAPPAAPTYFDPRAHAAPLPPGEFRPAQGLFAGRADTAEIARPPASVTDHTTRLLAEQDNTEEL